MARGKFLFVGNEKLYVRGVTYGPFRPDVMGNVYPDHETLERDLASMAASGFNAIRVYTLPPRYVLDAARRHNLYVLVGLPWEQHIAFLDERERASDIEHRVRAAVRACAGHPAVLAYAIGNEIPAPIVRWHGHRRVERFLERLYRAVKDEDPDALVTYVNYPSTEYLELPFLDFVCFNVYLESPERLGAYLARLQNLAGDRPLVMGEIGLDSRRNGEITQARTLTWQIRTAFAAGCGGLFLFSWTDDWHRGGHDIVDWDFGLTDRRRHPKAALAAAREALARVPFSHDMRWPRISVVVCSYNGERTIRDCLDGVRRLEYPEFEVILVDDGSTDHTADIGRDFGARVISTENRGLSSARNTGMRAARGEIVAYIDDDASPDPHWLHYLAATFLSSDYVGVGGPNLPPPGDGAIADCVANAPGGPIHVLLSDHEAEHIPGCNMAFRKDRLEEIGGFDPRFRSAGDDVDVCWRLQERGWKLGFSPAAVVWHHRRDSIRAYWKQQVGYGKAEALLEQKWPEKYNRVGHLTWAGRLYGSGGRQRLGWRRGRIYQGLWGSAPYQSVYAPSTDSYTALALMPEWYLVVAVLAALTALGGLWPPLLVALPLLVVAFAVPILQASAGAARASFPTGRFSRSTLFKLRALTALLHLLQPLARLCGRLSSGLVPWRSRAPVGSARPWPCTASLWSERWQTAPERLHALETRLRTAGASVLRGSAFDGWDLEVQGGLLGMVRLRMAVEEHGGGRQLVRIRWWPRCSQACVGAWVTLGGLCAWAAFDRAALVTVLLGGATLLFGFRAALESGAAMAVIRESLPAVDQTRPRGELTGASANRRGPVPRPHLLPAWYTHADCWQCRQHGESIGPPEPGSHHSIPASHAEVVEQAAGGER